MKLSRLFISAPFLFQVALSTSVHISGAPKGSYYSQLSSNTASASGNTAHSPPIRPLQSAVETGPSPATNTTSSDSGSDDNTHVAFLNVTNNSDEPIFAITVSFLVPKFNTTNDSAAAFIGVALDGSGDDTGGLLAGISVETNSSAVAISGIAGFPSDPSSIQNTPASFAVQQNDEITVRVVQITPNNTVILYESADTQQTASLYVSTNSTTAAIQGNNFQLVVITVSQDTLFLPSAVLFPQVTAVNSAGRVLNFDTSDVDFQTSNIQQGGNNITEVDFSTDDTTLVAQIVKLT